MSHALSAILMRYNPLGARKDAFLGWSGMCAFWVACIFLILAGFTLPFPQDINNPQLRLSLLSIATFFIGGGISVSLFAYRNRARRRAVQNWIRDTAPSWEVLAHLANSPEHEEVERETAAKHLDAVVPAWRLRATALVPFNTMGVLGGKVLPRLLPSSLPEIGFGVMSAIGVLLVFVCGILSMASGHTGIEWVNTLPLGPLVFGVLFGFALLAWGDYEEGKWTNLRRGQWESAVLASFSFAEILTYQADPSTSKYDKACLQRLLNRHHPGWSLNAQTPLWDVLCECEPST